MLSIGLQGRPRWAPIRRRAGGGSGTEPGARPMAPFANPGEPGARPVARPAAGRVRGPGARPVAPFANPGAPRPNPRCDFPSGRRWSVAS